jgi:hypothetical protein
MSVLSLTEASLLVQSGRSPSCARIARTHRVQAPKKEEILKAVTRITLVVAAVALPVLLSAQTSTGPGLEEQCQALMGQYDGITGAMEVLDRRVDRMLHEVDTAPARKQVEKLTAVLRELVAQRRDLRDGLLRLQLGLALFAARAQANPGAPGADCPLLSEILVQPWPPSSGSGPEPDGRRGPSTKAPEPADTAGTEAGHGSAPADARGAATGLSGTSAASAPPGPDAPVSDSDANHASENPAKPGSDANASRQSTSSAPSAVSPRATPSDSDHDSDSQPPD